MNRLLNGFSLLPREKKGGNLSPPFCYKLHIFEHQRPLEKKHLIEISGQNPQNLEAVQF